MALASSQVKSPAEWVSVSMVAVGQKKNNWTVLVGWTPQMDFNIFTLQPHRIPFNDFAPKQLLEGPIPIFAQTKTIEITFSAPLSDKKFLSWIPQPLLCHRFKFPFTEIRVSLFLFPLSFKGIISLKGLIYEWSGWIAVNKTVRILSRNN